MSTLNMCALFFLKMVSISRTIRRVLLLAVYLLGLKSTSMSLPFSPDQCTPLTVTQSRICRTISIGLFESWNLLTFIDAFDFRMTELFSPYAFQQTSWNASAGYYSWALDWLLWTNRMVP
ncbi:hypothetical protein TNCV_2261641 [Trichonephila clavipes]|nr:hypothetical protein TNCV_2261641 [Trichonephila clavipes]